jgi:hypothetical protein
VALQQIKSILYLLIVTFLHKILEQNQKNKNKNTAHMSFKKIQQKYLTILLLCLITLTQSSAVTSNILKSSLGKSVMGGFDKITAFADCFSGGSVTPVGGCFQNNFCLAENVNTSLNYELTQLK